MKKQTNLIYFLFAKFLSSLFLAKNKNEFNLLMIPLKATKFPKISKETYNYLYCKLDKLKTNLQNLLNIEKNLANNHPLNPL
jgi:hypothetical protein